MASSTAPVDGVNYKKGERDFTQNNQTNAKRLKYDFDTKTKEEESTREKRESKLRWTVKLGRMYMATDRGGQQCRVIISEINSDKTFAGFLQDGSWSHVKRIPKSYLSTLSHADKPEKFPSLEWQYNGGVDIWIPFNAEIHANFSAAQTLGMAGLVYCANDNSYAADLCTGCQTNRATRTQRRFRCVPHSAAHVPAPLPPVPKSSPGAHSPRGSCEHDRSSLQFQWQLKTGAWVDYEDDENDSLVNALRARERHVRYAVRGYDYEIDLRNMVQVNLGSSQMRSVRVISLRSRSAQAGEGTDSAGTFSDRPKRFSLRPDAPRREPSVTTPRPKGTPHFRPTGEPAGPPPRSGGSPHFRPRDEGVRHGRASSEPSSQLATCDVETSRPAHVLPRGVDWPSSDSARSGAETIFGEFDSTLRSSADIKKKAHRAACLRWHPDKNPDDEDTATEVFQFVQSLKPWYLDT